MADLLPCIYCGERFDPTRGEGDHVLPSRLFGEFEGDGRFRGACTNCNNQFGRYEQVLSQSSQLGFYRRVINPNLGRRANRGGLLQRGAHGNPRPQTTAMMGNRRLLVATDPNDPTNITPVDHLSITATNGEVHHVRLFAGMTVDRLREDIEDLSIGEFKEVAMDCDPAVTDQLVSLIQQMFPDWRFEQRGDTEPGTYRLHSTTRFQFCGAYFQGLAKIAFHYYLVHNQNGFLGCEPEFAEIRSFIQNGGNPDSFFHSSGREFAVPYGPQPNGQVLCPADWCHVMAAMDDGGPVVVYMQLFVGPGAIPPPNFVTLGTPARCEVRARGAYGHVYRYDNHRHDRYAGAVIAADLFRLR